MAGSFNTEFDEMAAGGSPNGSYLIYTTNEEFQVFNLKITYKAPKRSLAGIAEYGLVKS